MAVTFPLLCPHPNTVPHGETWVSFFPSQLNPWLYHSKLPSTVFDPLLGQNQVNHILFNSKCLLFSLCSPLSGWPLEDRGHMSIALDIFPLWPSGWMFTVQAYSWKTSWPSASPQMCPSGSWTTVPVFSLLKWLLSLVIGILLPMLVFLTTWTIFGGRVSILEVTFLWV